MKCLFEEFEAAEAGRRRVRCKLCGRVTAPTGSDITRIHAQCSKRGWGDYLAYWIAFYLGITKADLNRLLGKDCGCQKRQEKVNRLGEWWGRLWSRPPSH